MIKCLIGNHSSEIIVNINVYTQQTFMDTSQWNLSWKEFFGRCIILQIVKDKVNPRDNEMGALLYFDLESEILAERLGLQGVGASSTFWFLWLVMPRMTFCTNMRSKMADMCLGGISGIFENLV